MRNSHLTISQTPGKIPLMTPKRTKTKLTDQLRRAVDAAEKSRYRIALDAGIDHATLSRFMNRKGGLSMDGLDRLAEALGLELTVKQAAQKRKR
jgi:DNA-binding phage protein